VYVTFLVANVCPFSFGTVNSQYKDFRITEYHHHRNFHKGLYNTAYEFFNIHSILSEEQFGFREVLSTDVAVYSFAVGIICALNGNIIGA